MLNQSTQHGSSDFQETQTFFADKGLTLRLAGGNAANADRRFRSTINVVPGRELYIAYLEYATDVEVDFPAEREDYGFSIPYGGGMAAAAGGEMVACTRKCTVLASPGRPQRLFLAGGARRLALSVQQDLVRRRLTTLTGEVVRGTVEFEPMLDVTCGPGKVITSNMELIVREQDRGTDVFADRIREAHFEETVLSTLLLYHKHSHSMLLDRPVGAPASRDVKRVVDFLHENIENPVRLEDLVAIAGVPGRTLNEHFRAFVGIPPITYLQRLRLQAVRRVLMSGEATSVTCAAMGYGFLHMGRFAGAYRAQFGETPSATLSLGRRMLGSFKVARGGFDCDHQDHG